MNKFREAIPKFAKFDASVHFSYVPRALYFPPYCFILDSQYLHDVTLTIAIEKKISNIPEFTASPH